MRAWRKTVGFDLCDHICESGRPGLETAAVEREPRFFGSDVEYRLCKDVALVGLRRYHMPGDAVAAFSFEDSPARRVQTGEARQRSIMKVYRTLARLLPSGFGQHSQVGDTEKPVVFHTFKGGGEIGTPLQRGNVLFHCPRPDGGIGRDDAGHAMPSFKEQLATLNEERFITDEKGVEHIAPAIQN